MDSAFEHTTFSYVQQYVGYRRGPEVWSIPRSFRNSHSFTPTFTWRQSSVFGITHGEIAAGSWHSWRCRLVWVVSVNCHFVVVASNHAKRRKEEQTRGGGRAHEMTNDAHTNTVKRGTMRSFSRVSCRSVGHKYASKISNSSSSKTHSLAVRHSFAPSPLPPVSLFFSPSDYCGGCAADNNSQLLRHR